jgi:hypothetical protein
MIRLAHNRAFPHQKLGGRQVSIIASKLQWCGTDGEGVGDERPFLSEHENQGRMDPAALCLCSWTLGDGRVLGFQGSGGEREGTLGRQCTAAHGFT